MDIHKKSLSFLTITLITLSFLASITPAISTTQWPCYSSGDSGCSVSPDGETLVNDGGSFGVNYSADTGYVISSVTTDGVTDSSMRGTTGGTVVIGGVHESHTVEVASEVQTFTITAGVIGDGEISPSATVNYGDSATFSYSATGDSYVGGAWIDDIFTFAPGYGASGGSYTFSGVTSDHSIVIAFDAYTYTITPSNDSHSTISPSTPQVHIYGDSQPFTYSAQAGYNITSVLVDGAPLNLTTYPNSYTFSNIQGDHTISVSSAQSLYCSSTTANTTIANATAKISSYWNSPAYNLSGVIFSSNNTGAWTNSTWTAFSSTPSWANATVTLNATIGNKLSYIFYANDTGGNWANSGIQTITLTGYAITVSNDTHSQISPATTVYVPYGGSQNFTFSADDGYIIQNVIINGSTSAATTSPYQFIDLRGPSSIAISTTNITYTVNATSSLGATIYPSGSLIVPAGTWMNFTCSVNAGYTLDNFYINGTAAGINILVDNQYSFLPTGNTTIHLTATANIQPSGGGGGGGGWNGNHEATTTPQPTTTSLSSASNKTSPNNFLFLVGIVAIFVFGVTIVYSRNVTKKAKKQIQSWNT